MRETFEFLSFYRGVSARYETRHPTLHATRRDRLPRDMKPELHQLADEWFFKKFGIKYRSQSLFLSSDENVATSYAASAFHVMRIIPIGEYSYCWSSSIQDLLQICITDQREENLLHTLENSNYKQTDLAQAHAYRHEVMLFCERYICIPNHLI